MKTKKSFGLLCLGILLGGCSSFDNILPDRKKEYQYSEEIDALEIPPDLTAASIEQSPDYLGAQSGISSYTELMKEKERIASGEAELMPEVSLVQSTETSGSYLEVAEEFPRAWRIIGRAISNVGIEVFDQNRSIGIYYVLLAPEEVITEEQINDPSDRGEDDLGLLLSDFSFITGDDKDAPSEQEYRVKLEDNGGVTVVRVLNNVGKPQSDGPGLSLLERIQERLQQNLGVEPQIADSPNTEQPASAGQPTDSAQGSEQPASTEESDEPILSPEETNEDGEYRPSDDDAYEIPSGDLRG